MTMFAPKAFDGAYAAFMAHDAGTASWVYVLASSATRPVDPISLGQAWMLTAPWSLIVRESEWDFAAETPSAAAATLNLATNPAGTLLLAWRADPSISAAWWPADSPAPEFQIVVTDPNGPNRQIRSDTRIQFGNIVLTLTVGATVSLGGDGSSLRIVRTGSQLSIGRDPPFSLLTFDNAELATSVSGNTVAGGLKASGLRWSPRSLFLLGQDNGRAPNAEPPEIRFWWGEAAGQRLRLPLFPSVDVTAPRIGLDLALNPALPFDPGATRFDIATASQDCFASTGGVTTIAGEPVGLTPVSGIGFHLAPGFLDGKTRTYLAPYGRFALVAPKGVSGAFRLMPGLSGLEYIEAAAGDLLDLVPGQPAFGKLAAPETAEPPRLTSTCTTSWMRLMPSAAPSGAYHAQPLRSVFYASADGKSLPRAADAKVANLTGSESPYPLAPYANSRAQSIQSPPRASDVAAFEQTHLAGARGAILGSRDQPIFTLDGKMLNQSGATPRGLFADIGPASRSPAATRSRLAAREFATPPGQWRRLTLAKGIAKTLTLEPSPAGVVDPVIANAFLQPDLFMVYNNWSGHPIGCSGQLDVGGFSFGGKPLDGKDPSMLLVAKFNGKISLQDMFALPERWRDAETLVGNAAAILAAQGVFAAALKTAQEASKTNPALFDDFLHRIAADPRWTGLVLFQAPVDGNAMPPTLQVLVAGMRAPLRAHHLAIDVTALSSQGGVPQAPGPSSVAGVISYDDPGDAPPAAGDYGFYTQSLKVGIFSSSVTSFNAEVGITAGKLFGRAVRLRPQAEDPPVANTFLLKGVYQVVADVPTVTFRLADARVFDFAVDPSLSGGGLSRILEKFEVDTAGIMPRSGKKNDDGTTTHQAQITLNGQLWFAEDPFGAGIDLFSYGIEDGAGLALNNFSLEMSFVLNANGQRKGDPTFALDYSRLAVTDTYRALRTTGMAGGLPFKLKGILADDAGLDVAKLGGKPVQVLQIAGKETSEPHFALQFELIIGSLGELSGVHAGLTAEMRLAWGPLDTTPDADGALLTIQLPGASAGFGSLNVQGMLQLVFGDANLMRVPYAPKDGGATIPVYAILFNNVALSLMGIKLPPKVLSDLILFSDPANATSSNLAACLAVRQQ